MTQNSHEVTQLLIQWSNGDKAALDKLMPLIYEELRQLARHYMNRERPGHTLQTTALVNEAYVRLVNRKGVHWQNRAHFFAIAAQLMRSILVDHARSHAYAKRGGGARKIALDEAMVISQERAAEVVALDEALDQLAEIDPDQSRIVELRFFGGLTIEETAEVMHVSHSTVEREWKIAKAWLKRELTKKRGTFSSNCALQTGLSPTVGRTASRLQIVMITREQWQRIKAVFHSAQECPPAERASFINRACGDDESMRQEVESLLAADETNENFLGAPAYELMAGVLADEKVEFVAGQEVGPYTILSSLGTGGMGQVYLAKDARLGRKVALKLLPFDFARDHGRVRRFGQETRAASARKHPNVCVIHEIGQTNNGRHFIAMEYIDGITLRDRLARKPRKLLEALDLAAQVAWALEAAHAAGIVHRDIKPENIMLRKDGYVKVLDFGIAKLNERLSKLNDINEASTIDKVQTEPGMRIGTVNYMSPEQLREVSVDARTDIWSLGVVLHEMVTGTTPFGARTTNETIAAILGRQPIEFAPPSNEVPAAFQHIVKRALGKKRRERYQRVKDLADDLRKLRQQIATSAPQEFSSQPMSSKQSAEDFPTPIAVDDRSTTLERTKALAVRTAESILSEIKEHPKATTLAGLTAVVVLLLISPNLPRL